MTDKKAYIIAGPTASGKSDFADMLARRVNGTIINCDSVQIYRGIENISASPFAGRAVTDCIDGVPYRLFSILGLDEHISVADYIKLARQEYDAAVGEGRVPIFVGGTGYYINGIINGIANIPDIRPEIREQARKMVAQDLHAARKMVPGCVANDPQRVARAIEVFLQTGRHLSDWWRDARVGAIMPTPTKILIKPQMSQLRVRIASRVPQMLAGGALDEARMIIQNNFDATRAIGAAQLCDLLLGKVPQDVAIRNWITKTNQYAKRQRTWFKTQFVADVIINRVPKPDDINLVF